MLSQFFITSRYKKQKVGIKTSRATKPSFVTEEHMPSMFFYLSVNPHKKDVDVLANISFLIMYIYDGAANLVAARALPWVTYVSGATGCGCLELRLYVIRFCHL